MSDCINSDAKVSRGTFLKAAGVSLALPMLQSMPLAKAQAATRSAPAKRLVCVGTFLGFFQPAFFP